MGCFPKNWAQQILKLGIKAMITDISSMSFLFSITVFLKQWIMSQFQLGPHSFQCVFYFWYISFNAMYVTAFGKMWQILCILWLLCYVYYGYMNLIYIMAINGSQTWVASSLQGGCGKLRMLFPSLTCSQPLPQRFPSALRWRRPPLFQDPHCKKLGTTIMESGTVAPRW